jgi:hypothetical protein
MEVSPAPSDEDKGHRRSANKNRTVQTKKNPLGLSGYWYLLAVAVEACSTVTGL